MQETSNSKRDVLSLVEAHRALEARLRPESDVTVDPIERSGWNSAAAGVLLGGLHYGAITATACYSDDRFGIVEGAAVPFELWDHGAAAQSELAFQDAVIGSSALRTRQ